MENIPIMFLVLISTCYCIWPQPKHISVDKATSISIPLFCDVSLILKSKQNFPTNSKCMITQAFNRASTNFKSQVQGSCPTNSSVIIRLTVLNPSKMNVNPSQDSTKNESYTISINNQSEIVIEASTTIGALRAAWTMFQVPTTSGFIRNPIFIRDEPSFIYRGIMVDTTRSIGVTEGERHPIIRLYEIIDRMEVVKFNILHWHLTDTDGLSFEVENTTVSTPYSVSDIRRVVAYGKDRGVTVLPEVDVMGHTGTVWGRQTNIPDFAPEDCPYQFNLDSPQARKFVLDLFNTMFTKIFDGCPILGTGQDEVAPCGNNYVKDATSLQNRLGTMAKKSGKSLLVWADTILEQGLRFDTRNTLVAPWKVYEGRRRYSDGVNELVEQGYKVATYNQNPWYIGRKSTAKDLYMYNPLDGVKAKNVRGVVGGAVSLWEPSLEDLERGIFWPMAASVGEILWTGRGSGIELDEERFNQIAKFISNVPDSVVMSEICNK